MDLKKYDGLCVRIIDLNGDTFDGICRYHTFEHGRCEESLQILGFFFYKSNIKEIESLEGRKGPYGKFLDPYGKIEEMAVQEGFGSILDVLFGDEKEHVYRMLHCLDKYFDPYFGYDFPYRYETIGALCELYDVTDDGYIKEEAGRLLDMWGK